MKYLFFILLLLLSPLVLVCAVVVSPLYFAYKIISRVLDYREAKKGYNPKQDSNPLMSFALPFVKDMLTKKPV